MSITIFKSVIVILNQSSDYYKENFDCDNFHSYVYFENYSIRTRKDTCVLCKQVTDAKKMIKLSATNCMLRYWEEQEACHRCVSMKYLNTAQLVEGRRKLEKCKMLCLHVANEKLSSLQENDKIDEVRRCVVDTLLNSKWNEELFGELSGRKLNDRIEWLMSYIRILSDPVLVFTKVTHEVIFTIIIQLLNYLLEDNKTFMADMRRKIPDLKNIFDDFDELNSDLDSEEMSSTDKHKMRYILLLLLINRLSAMGSIFIIRKENIERILMYYNLKVKEFGVGQTFEFEYLTAIKQLTSMHDDECKERWLEYLLINNRECGQKSNENLHLQILKGFYTKMYMENINVFRNAICNITKEVRVQVEKQKVDGRKNEQIRELIYEKTCLDQLKNYYYDNFNDIFTWNFSDNTALLNDICILYKYVLYGPSVFYDVREYYIHLTYCLMKVTNAENVQIVMPNSEGGYCVIGDSRGSEGEWDMENKITSDYFDQTFIKYIKDTLICDTYYLDDSRIGILGFSYQYKKILQNINSEQMVYFCFRFPKELKNERYKYLRNVLLFRHEIGLKLEEDLSSNAFAALE